MSFQITITAEEARVLLNWHDIATRRSRRFGSAQFVFPVEEYLLSRLKRITNEADFDDMDCEVFIDWMQKALNPMPSSATVVFPQEQQLAEKLQQAADTLQRLRQAAEKPDPGPAGEGAGNNDDEKA